MESGNREKVQFQYRKVCQVAFLKSKPAVIDCDLKTRSHRIAILFCLTIGHRDQTIKCLNLDCIKIPSDKVILFLLETLKTTRPGHQLPPMQLKIFKGIELCEVAHLKQCIKTTAPFRNTGTEQLLLSFVQPHKPISTATQGGV